MVLSTQLGNAAAGAFQAMLSVHNLAFALSMGFGSAAGRPGRQCGRRRRARRGLAARADRRRRSPPPMLGLISLPLVFAAPLLVWPFSDDPEVLALAASMLAIMGAFLVFDGLQYVFGAALRSLGEQVWAGVNGIIGFFVVTGGLGWLLVRAGLGPGRPRLCGRRSGMLVCARAAISARFGVGRSGDRAEAQGERAAAARHVRSRRCRRARGRAAAARGTGGAIDQA